MTALKLDHRFSFVITDHSVFGSPQTLNVAHPQASKPLYQSRPCHPSLDSTPWFPSRNDQPRTGRHLSLRSETSRTLRCLPGLPRIQPVADSTLPTPPARPPAESRAPFSFSSSPRSHTFLLFFRLVRHRLNDQFHNNAWSP